MKLRTIVVLAIVLAVVSMLAPARPVPVLAGSQVTAPLQQGTPVYTAAFGKKHLAGWHVASGPAWHVGRKGILTFGGSASGGLLAPVSTGGMHDLSVQASIHAVGASTQTTSGYGVVVRFGGGNGVKGGSFSSSIDPTFNRPLLVWEGDDVGGADVTLRPGYNTYRIDVHGADFTLSIDGHQIVQFTIADFGGAKAHPAVGLWSLYRKIQVKSFTVSRLPRTAPLPAAPPVKAVNFNQSDVPAGLDAEGGHYFTNQELADLSNVPVDRVNATGLLLSYQANFGTSARPTSGQYGLFSYVYAFRSSQDAQSGLAQDWRYFETKWSGPNFEASDVAGLGDEAHQYIVDYTEAGFSPSISGTMVGVFFRRGSYEVNMFEDFVQGSMPRTAMVAQATALAKIIDGRIQAGP